MSMTRKHYIDIADAIIEARRTALADKPPTDDPYDHRWTVDLAILAVVREMCIVFQIDNQGFKKDTFTDYIDERVTK